MAIPVKIQLLRSTSPIYLDQIDGPIFKRFLNPDHAQALCDGTVWLSTLQACRNYEHAERGDPDEGRHFYQSDAPNAYSAYANADEAGKGEIAARLGIEFVDGHSMFGFISQCRSTARLPDAWAICCAEYPGDDLAESFGKHCVRIDRPMRLFQHVTNNLKFKENGGIAKAILGRVIYNDRRYAGLDPEPGPLGFVKPVHPYAAQREIRFLWTAVRGKVIKAQEINCAVAKRLCTRIS